VCVSHVKSWACHMSNHTAANIFRLVYNTMSRSLFFTTLTNHRPISLPVTARAIPGPIPVPVPVPVPAAAAAAAPAVAQPPRQFHAKDARVPTVNTASEPAPAPALRDLLARSRQPIFSVTAMFGVKSGGTCRSCGH